MPRAAASAPVARISAESIRAVTGTSAVIGRVRSRMPKPLKWSRAARSAVVMAVKIIACTTMTGRMYCG